MSAAGSLASATSSRVDSASKHIQPCKVNTDYMISLLEAYCDAPARELQNNKMRYCMHKVRPPALPDPTRAAPRRA